jgi:dTDP-4-dehydrorhamnose 3,5-epimerase
LDGVLIIDVERNEDERGFFARVGCVDEFAANGIIEQFPQVNLSHNARRGTLRGMHYAVSPAVESKVVRCVSGAIHDVVVDVRPGSPTFGQWLGVELSRINGRALYIPAGLAHGFLTLDDNTDVLYQMGDVFRPDSAHGFRWDDPLFGVQWPFEPIVISDRDRTYADFA